MVENWFIGLKFKWFKMVLKKFNFFLISRINFLSNFYREIMKYQFLLERNPNPSPTQWSIYFFSILI